MIILEGKNLGERQKDLNQKVNDAAFKNVAFNEFKSMKNETDADVIFKIDLAAKYKNLDYILKIFMSGDNMHITRALNKSKWICDDEYFGFINPEYLHQNIFPSMSIKMKNKLLDSFSRYLKNETQAIQFYDYCKTNRLINVAAKFLLKTPESYRMQLIKDNKDLYIVSQRKDGYLKYFIGNSFELADAYLGAFGDKSYCQVTALHALRDMYLSDPNKYLDLVEKYGTTKLGIRVSRSIMKNHKDRVLKKPELYLRILLKQMIVMYSNVDDAGVYMRALIPKKSSEFFDVFNFHYTSNEFILDIVPNKKFDFIKKVFNEKYPGEEFEMCLKFYESKMYKIMTTEEKEYWALKHIESGDEILGDGNDFLWYEYVNFEKAFQEIQKYILITKDRVKRASLLRVLAKASRSEEANIQKLLKHFYERHVNESLSDKTNFLDELLRVINVFNLTKATWDELEKIFYSMNVFDVSAYNRVDASYRHIALIYYIIHGLKVTEILEKFIDIDAIRMHIVKNFTKTFKDQEEKLVFDYFLQFYVAKVKALGDIPYEEAKIRINKYITFTLNLLQQYEKTKEDIPEVINKYLQLALKDKYFHRFLDQPKYLTRDDIKKFLKKDSSLVVEKFPEIKNVINERSNSINWLLKKIKTYFPQDLTPQYITLFNEVLLTEDYKISLISAAVYSVFLLADEPYKTQFLSKYIPTDPKIDHAKIPTKHLYIQKSICALSCFSRPQLPLDAIKPFITGDYVKSCLPMFNAYLMNLPPPQCLQFVNFLLNNPISIQKHGIRIIMTLTCFSTDYLIHLVSSIWGKSKNVSLRAVLYTSLYQKVLIENGSDQIKLFDYLIKLTSQLNKDDDDGVFDMLSENKLPKDLIGQYLEVAWKTVSNLPNKMKFFANVIKRVGTEIYHVSDDFLDKEVEEHFNVMFQITDSKPLKPILIEMYENKWALAAKHLAHIKNEDRLVKKTDMVKQYLNTSIALYNDDTRYFGFKYYFQDLIERMDSESYQLANNDLYKVNVIFESILKLIQSKVPEKEIYKHVWFLEISIISRRIIADALSKKEASDDGKIRLAKEATVQLAKDFGNIMISYSEKNKLFFYIFSHLEENINNNLGNIKTFIACHTTLNANDYNAVFVENLLEFPNRLIYLFAATLLPSSCPENCYDEYANALSKLKSFDDDELQFMVYNKFATNYKYLHN